MLNETKKHILRKIMTLYVKRSFNIHKIMFILAKSNVEILNINHATQLFMNITLYSKAVGL